jgi:hypothetical protein
MKGAGAASSSPGPRRNDVARPERAACARDGSGVRGPWDRRDDRRAPGEERDGGAGDPIAGVRRRMEDVIAEGDKGGIP